MKLDAAFDTAATTTAICIANSRDGAVVFETSAPTNTDDLYRVLEPYCRGRSGSGSKPAPGRRGSTANWSRAACRWCCWRSAMPPRR